MGLSHTHRDDDVWHAVGELYAFCPVFDLGVIAQIDAQDVKLERFALRPVLIPLLYVEE